MTDIVKRLRELALCRHSDISIGDEAALKENDDG